MGIYYLVFGPAYLDVVVETAQPLLPSEPALLLDQSLAATGVTPRDDGLLVVLGPTGDVLRFSLPACHAAAAASYHLAEPVLARLRGAQAQPVRGDYAVARFLTQLGGMGAGYAAAFAGVLCAPVGTEDTRPDATAWQVLDWLAQQQIRTAPAYLPDCASDRSLVLLSARGDKLAIGVRQAMVRWRAGKDERALAETADALVFCGAPNVLLAEICSRCPAAPVMCAPALRNVCDTAPSLAELAPYIHYMTMNALEWAQLAQREELRRQVPVISITDGPRGSRIYCSEQEFAIPALPFHGAANTNRAGETYGSTFFKVLLATQPDFYRHRHVDAAVALRAGQIATAQATRQLAIAGFAFPPDDWM